MPLAGDASKYAMAKFDDGSKVDARGIPQVSYAYGHQAGSMSSPRGQIDTVKPDGELVAATFKKVSFKAPVCDQWKETVVRVGSPRG